jgi:hypothetical protein
MLKQLSVILLLAISCAAVAKDKNKITPLPESAVAALSGKSVIITRHDKPSFTAFTAGKAAFALLGAGAMIVAGNQIVKENEIADPADVLEHELAAAVIKQYGLTLMPGSSPVIKASKSKDIAATQGDVDYILDLHSTGWMFAYIPTNWDAYWISYSAHVQLINRVSGKALADGICYSDTQKHPMPPNKESMLANKAQLLKDVTASLGWHCAQVFAKEQFRLADGALAATPPELADPQTTYGLVNGKASAPAAK